MRYIFSSEYFDADGKQIKLYPAKILFLSLLYIGHYIYRSLYYTWFVSHSMKDQTISVFVSAFAFNLLNAYNISRAICSIQNISTSLNWAGAFFFFYGLEINIRSDNHLANLRRKKEKENEEEYKIPFFGWFENVSCANYFGEILEWFGFALILNESLAGWAFFFCTCANLIPRGLAYHEYYKKKFPGYPTERKAVIPWIL